MKFSIGTMTLAVLIGALVLAAVVALVLLGHSGPLKVSQNKGRPG